MIDVYLVHDDVSASAVVRSAVAANQEFTLVSERQKGNDGMYDLAAINNGRPRLMVVRLQLPDTNGLEMVAAIRQKHPDVTIVPILEGTEGGIIWQRLLQLELPDVINGLLEGAEISEVLRSAAVRSQRRFDEIKASRGGQVTESFVVTVMSARGGVGKTVLATNLAASMAQMHENVALMDFSLNSGDFPVMLDDVPRNTVMDAAMAGAGLDVELVQNLLATHKLGFRYLACPNEEFDPKPLDYNVAAAVVQIMRSVAAYVVIDTGLAYAEPTIAAVDASDIVFMVTTRDVTRLLAAQRMLKFLREREIPTSKVKVLINEAEVGVEISESEIESTLEHPVNAYIPSNPGAVTYSINRGEPMVTADPTDAFSQIVTRLANLCYHHWQDKPMEGDADAGKGSIFKKKTRNLGQASKVSFW